MLRKKCGNGIGLCEEVLITMYHRPSTTTKLTWHSPHTSNHLRPRGYVIRPIQLEDDLGGGGQGQVPAHISIPQDYEPQRSDRLQVTYNGVRLCKSTRGESKIQSHSNGIN